MRTLMMMLLLTAATPAFGSKVWLAYDENDGTLTLDTKTEKISFFQLASGDFLEPATLESDLLDHALFTVNLDDHIMWVSEDLEPDDLFMGSTTLGPLLPPGLSLAEVEASLTQREFVNGTIEPFAVETLPIKVVSEPTTVGLAALGLISLLPLRRLIGA